MSCDENVCENEYTCWPSAIVSSFPTKDTQHARIERMISACSAVAKVIGGDSAGQECVHSSPQQYRPRKPTSQGFSAVGSVPGQQKGPSYQPPMMLVSQVGRWSTVHSTGGSQTLKEYLKSRPIPAVWWK